MARAGRPPHHVQAGDAEDVVGAKVVEDGVVVVEEAAAELHADAETEQLRAGAIRLEVGVVIVVVFLLLLVLFGLVLLRLLLGLLLLLGLGLRCEGREGGHEHFGDVRDLFVARAFEGYGLVEEQLVALVGHHQDDLETALLAGPHAADHGGRHARLLDGAAGELEHQAPLRG